MTRTETKLINALIALADNAAEDETPCWCRSTKPTWDRHCRRCLRTRRLIGLSNVGLKAGTEER